MRVWGSQPQRGLGQSPRTLPRTLGDPRASTRGVWPLPDETIRINRAPVLTLWAAIVAERLGYDADAAATMGKWVAGANAQAKGRSLGIYGPRTGERGAEEGARRGEEFSVEVCGRSVPAKRTPEGIRAVVGDEPLDPAPVHRYLQTKFGEALPAARAALVELAGAYSPEELADQAFRLYEQFRPQVAKGQRGWGQQGELDLGLVWSLAQRG